jgi:RNA polymerase sigma-70 factor (ECF subfamily)
MTTEEREHRFRALYEAARPRVAAYALRRVASHEDAADVVAETFTIAWRRLDNIPGACCGCAPRADV